MLNRAFVGATRRVAPTKLTNFCPGTYYCEGFLANLVTFYRGLPTPAAFSASVLGLEPVQHCAIFPSTTTVGTRLIP